MNWVNAASVGLLAASATGLFLNAKNMLAQWRLSLRREKILAEGFEALSGTLYDNNCTRHEALTVLSVVHVRLGDEINNQRRHRRDRPWPRVPKVGEEWPDFEPAEVTFVEVGE